MVADVVALEEVGGLCSGWLSVCCVCGDRPGTEETMRVAGGWMAVKAPDDDTVEVEVKLGSVSIVADTGAVSVSSTPSSRFRLPDPDMGWERQETSRLDGSYRCTTREVEKGHVIARATGPMTRARMLMIVSSERMSGMRRGSSGGCDRCECCKAGRKMLTLHIGVSVS